MQKCSFIIVLTLAINMAHAGEKLDVEVNPHGQAWLQVGQIVKSWIVQNHRWEQVCKGRLILDATVEERMRIVVMGEGQLYVAPSGRISKLFQIKEARGTYSIGNLDMPLLQFTVGYFGFKYNPDAMNLGEYLLRSGAYPPYIITNFDFAKVRLLGAGITNTLFDGMIRQHLLFDSWLDQPPYYDYSLSYLLGINLFKFADIGGGVSYCRLIPIDPEVTTKSVNIIYNDDGDSLGLYTMRGAKMMARLSLDPKRFIPAEIFGESDLRLYGEIAVLGLKNYLVHYDTLAQRIPIMFGFHLPGFKIVDMAAFEIEWYGARMINNPSYSESPFPGIADEYSEKDDWKWSFYLKFRPSNINKKILPGFAFKGLVARDHYRTEDEGGNYDENEVLRAPEDWHYKLRLEYGF